MLWARYCDYCRERMKGRKKRNKAKRKEGAEEKQQGKKQREGRRKKSADAYSGMMDTSPTGHFAYWTVRLLFGHFAYWTLCLLVISPMRHFAYRTVRLLDSSPTRHFAYCLDSSPTDCSSFQIKQNQMCNRQSVGELSGQ